MSKMTEAELQSFVNSALADANTFNASLMRENVSLFSYYLGEPLGDEEEGKSKVVSTDVFDLVEADMPSLVRVFLGANDILQFQPKGEQDADEAKDKTAYINYLVRQRPTSFKTIHDWMKDAEINKVSIVKYYMEEQTKAEYISYKGLDEDELVKVIEDLKARDKVIQVDIVSRADNDDATFDVNFKVIRKTKQVCIDGVPCEDFLISRNARDKDSAFLVGDRVTKTRGQLLAEGYPRDLVKKLPKYTADASGDRAKQQRFPNQGDVKPFDNHWANEWVQLENLYVLCDYDGDGIPERRRILKSGQEFLENEPYGIVPYALLSAILMPHAAIGRSRAEIAKPTQYVKTHLNRQILNNIYQVNNPRTAVNDENVELDDLLTMKFGGIVRVDGNPLENLMPLQTPYIGSQALEIVQYIDFSRAQTTGSLMASQGLSIDDLHKETATRFEGISDASEAKVELVARAFAETGFRELYSGLAWLVMHEQDAATEVAILGHSMKFDPTKWRYDQECISLIGEDTDELLANLGSLLTVQQGFQQANSPLVDNKKLYNTTSKIVKAMGQAKVSDYFNDPEIPQQVLQAQVEILTQENLTLKQQLQNPLAEAERIKAQAKIAVDGAKQQGDLAIEESKQRTDMNKFLLEFTQRNNEFQQELMARLTELELKYKEDVPGSSV